MEYYVNRLFDFNNRFHIALRIILPIIFLLGIGLVLLMSASQDQNISSFDRQINWIILGTFSFFILQYVRRQIFYEYAYILYIINIFLLIIPILVVEIVGGASSWINLGFAKFQPSELGKVIMVFVISKFLADNNENLSDFKKISYSILIVLIPSLLVFVQPDYGTAIIYLLILIPMLYWSGVSAFNLFIFLAPFVSIIAVYDFYIFYFWMLVVVILYYLFQIKLIYGIINFMINITSALFAKWAWDNLLKDHHRIRLEILFDPESAPYGAGYQIIQSKIAIGSGGLLGVGWGKGTQTHLSFLPVRDTDFILSVGAEELGLVLVLSIMISFLYFTYNMLDYSERIFNKFSSLILVGFSSIIFFHFIINFGMTIGLLPVIGLPLPFISYGGTFLLTCFAIVAIANNIISNDL